MTQVWEGLYDMSAVLYIKCFGHSKCSMNIYCIIFYCLPGQVFFSPWYPVALSLVNETQCYLSPVSLYSGPKARLSSTGPRRRLGLEESTQKPSHRIGARESKLVVYPGIKASATWWMRGRPAVGHLTSTYAQDSWEPNYAKLRRLSFSPQCLLYTSLGKSCQTSASVLARLAGREMATFYF